MARRRIHQVYDCFIILIVAVVYVTLMSFYTINIGSYSRPRYPLEVGQPRPVNGRHVFDFPDLSAFTMPKTALCNQGEGMHLLVAVSSFLQNIEQRLAIRKTWGQAIGKYGAVIFMIEQSNDHINIDDIIEESVTYHDIILLNLLDGIGNTTLKIISMFQWITMYCRNAQYILKVDDSTLVLPHNLWPYMAQLPFNNVAAGRVFVNTKHNRQTASKWFVSSEQWNKTTYPPYIDSTSCLFSSDVVIRIAEEAVKIEPFQFEDVFIGIV
ncbi:UDP-GalNAc:beta-1,3-N-acetylgalactosaminyltransferase 1-like [Saccoglossus kowalevskii]|uniref:Hexosyltransferase n=1 Tax=Saccoglossus kowalevskii TaxID=10224 RepID=A0ABM0N0S9_SACKO|nr:PREDICTED: UDP-GalNAc:beta-1,3-N-acetylgalactosaminyltransferase 1-like [Saccoglossus kowalevskii]